MKRDLDLIRQLMLHIEKVATDEIHVSDWNEVIDVNKEHLIIGHLKLLIEARFIEATVYNSLSDSSIIPRRLTMSGHDYLDSVRDPKIWRDTIAGLSKVGGSASLAIVQATATAILKASLDKAGINIL